MGGIAAFNILNPAGNNAYKNRLLGLCFRKIKITYLEVKDQYLCEKSLELINPTYDNRECWVYVSE